MRKPHGFTLVELVIGFLAGAIIAMVGVFLIAPADNWVFILERRSGISELELATERFVREVGRVKAPGNITAFTATRFTFTDIDDQAVDFQLTGSDLTRNGDAMARNIQSVAFEYKTQTGAVAAAATDIRVVWVTFVITSGQQTVRLKSAARIRNGV